MKEARKKEGRMERQMDGQKGGRKDNRQTDRQTKESRRVREGHLLTFGVDLSQFDQEEHHVHYEVCQPSKKSKQPF